MIRINLATRRQASYVDNDATKTGTSTLATSSVSSKFSALKLFGRENSGSIAKRVMIPVVLAIVLYFGTDFYMSHEIDRMKDEKTALEADRNKIQDELTRIKGFESVKNEVEKNELILRTKISTIEKLIKGRDTTLKSLVALTQALPKDVWLSELVMTDVNYNIKGATPDIGLVSDVMSRLGKSIYFKEVTLKSSTADPAGKTANFELTARKE